jgi:hypothetical protein
VKRKASAPKNNGHAKFGPFFFFSLDEYLLIAVTFFLITLDELERNVFLKIQTKIRMELELEEEAKIVMWRWPMSTLTERVMHQNLESKLEQVD